MHEGNLVACAAPKTCPLCGEHAGLLYQRSRLCDNPYLLQELGLEIRRQVAYRFRKCDACGSEYVGEGTHDWSIQRQREAYADVGSVRFPLPNELKAGGFLQYCAERLKPEIMERSPLIERTPDGWRWREQAHAS